jgi:hypothetical protein
MLFAAKRNCPYRHPLSAIRYPPEKIQQTTDRGWRTADGGERKAVRTAWLEEILGKE